jgi:histone-lysine N-methyltransferase SETD2
VPAPEYEYDELQPSKRAKIWDDAQLGIVPLGKSWKKNPSTSGSQPPPPPPPPRPSSPPREIATVKNPNQFSRESIQAIIARAAEAEAAKEAEAEAEAEAAAAAATATASAALEEAKDGGSRSGSRKKQKLSKKILTSEEREANKEKRLLKLVGAVVVKCMSKHSKAMYHDVFKKHAKEVLHFLSLLKSYPCTDDLSCYLAHPNYSRKGEEIVKL